MTKPVILTASDIPEIRRQSLKDDPVQIANHLIEDHGVDGALDAVRRGIDAAHANRDNYRLSIWREVSRAVQNQRDAADNQKAPAV